MAALVRVGFEINIPHEDPLPTGINHRAIEEVSFLIASYAATVWRSAVSGAVLPGMSGPINDPKYARSIRITGSADGGYRVTTNYPEAQRIEDGFAAYDMKPSLLNSPKAKITKDGEGRYINIPFRAYTRKSVTNPNRAVIPHDILTYVRRNDRYNLFDMRGQRTKMPLFLYGDEPEPTGSGTNFQSYVRDQDGPMVGPYTWNTGQFVGLTKTTTPGGQNRYFTFRRISSRRLVRLPDGRMVWRGSSEDAWIHPGQAANPVSEAVESFVRPQVDMIAEYLEGIS